MIAYYNPLNLFRSAFVLPSKRMAEPEALYKIEPSYDSTIAVEVAKTGLLRKHKHILVFERFNGQLYYSPDDPKSARIELIIDSGSLTCQDKWLKPKKRKKVAEFARSRVLAADRHCEMRFASSAISLKPLRGFVVEGKLALCGVEKPIRANVILGPQTNGRFQIDADVPLRLSDFGIKPPSALLGMIGTQNEAMVHLLIWASRTSA